MEWRELRNVPESGLVIIKMFHPRAAKLKCMFYLSLGFILKVLSQGSVQQFLSLES